MMFPRQSSGQTPVLNRMGLDQLKALFDQSMRPGGDTQFDPYAVLSAIRSKTEEAKFAQAQRNMAAMQQNQAQGIGSLAQQIRREADMVQPPVNMARGGIVAFDKGGSLSSEAIEKLRRDNMVTPEVQAQRDQIAAQTRAQRLKTPEAARAKLQQLDRAVAQATEADSKRIFELERRLTTQALRILESQEIAATLGRVVEAVIPPAGATTTRRAAPAEPVLGPQGPLLTRNIPAPPGTRGDILPDAASINALRPDLISDEQAQEELAQGRRALAAARAATPEIPVFEEDTSVLGPQGPLLTQNIPASPGTPGVVLPDAATFISRPRSPQTAAEQAAPGAAPSAAPAGPSASPVRSVFDTLVDQIAAREQSRGRELENRLSELRTRRGVSDEIAAGQAGIERLMAEQLANEQRMRDERMAEARKLYESRQGELKPDIARVLRNLSSRSGALFESLGEGVEKEEQRIRTGKEESRKELTAAQRESEEAGRNILKLRMLEAQRVQLIRENRQKDVDRIDDQIAELRDKVAGQDIEALKTQADIRLRQAQVEKPSELQERINLLMKNPAAFNRLFPSANDKVTAFQVMKEMSQNLVAIMSKGNLLPDEQKVYATRLEQLNSMMANLAGITMAAPQIQRARNPSTGQEIISEDGGKTWKDAKTGKPIESR